MLVAIDAGAKRRLRIIHVNQAHAIQPDGAVDIRERFFSPASVRISQPAAKRCAVSIQTPSGKSRQASMMARSSVNCEPMEVPCPAIFSSKSCRSPSFSPRAAWRSPCAMAEMAWSTSTVRAAAAGMDDQVIGAQGHGAHQFVMKRLHRPGTQNRVGGREIDQIIVVDHQRAELQFLAAGSEARGVRLRDSRGAASPHARAGGENLEGVGP